MVVLLLLVSDGIHGKLLTKPRIFLQQNPTEIHPSGGFLSHGGTPIAGWFIDVYFVQNPLQMDDGL